MTALIACSHGTRFAEGRATVSEILDLLSLALPGVRIEPAFVDVEQPEVDDVVARVAADGHAVVVPLLLSTGHHTKVDIGRAVAPYPHVVSAGTMGPHELLAQALLRRLGELPGGDAGRRPGDHIVLAAAGSSDPEAVLDVEHMRDLLADELPAPVSIGYGAGAKPRIPRAVAAAREGGADRVIAASYVLAPGHFANLVLAAGADQVSAPLGTDPAVISVIAQRYRAAAAALRHPEPATSAIGA
ncbi:sirohydrochlorin chelatase [Brachybacterium sp. GCM10030252]|uniref:sirohydrochlorin chelatase n=1 Tax=Brachybacterium sp. GCM10030252 TaxID=3273380 RepID=UPI003615195D